MRLRLCAVIGAIALLGGTVGALGGLFVGAIFLRVVTGSFGDDAFGSDFTRFAYAYAWTMGAAYGIILGPLLAWTLLRRVPLWRAIGETATGAAVGGVLMVILPRVAPFDAVLRIWWLRLALPPLCALIAAARLRHAYPRVAAAEQPEVASG